MLRSFCNINQRISPWSEATVRENSSNQVAPENGEKLSLVSSSDKADVGRFSQERATLKFMALFFLIYLLQCNVPGTGINY